MKVKEITESNNERELRSKLNQLKHMSKKMKQNLHEQANIDIPGGESTISTGLKKSWSVFAAGIKTIKNLELVSLIYEYYKQMSVFESQLKAGTITPQNYNEYHSYYAGQLIAKLGIAIAGYLSSGIAITLLLSLFRWIPGIGPLLVSIFGLLSNAARIYLVEQLKSEEGTKHLGELISASVLKDMGRFGVTAMDWLHDKILEAVKGENQTANTANPNAADTNQQQPNQDLTNPPAQDDLKIKRIADPELDYTPQGLHKDKNGFLIY